MKNFSKLFLISLLAGSMMLAGCGESNPTGADVSSDNTTNNGQTSTDTNTTEEQVKTYTISGKVAPTNGYVASNAKFEVTYTDSANPNNTKTTSGIVFTFSGLKSGTYTLTAKETQNGNYTLQNPLTVNLTNADQDNLEIIMQFTGTLPTFTLKGVIVDNQDQGIKFATVTADNGIKTVTATTNPDNGNFTLADLTPGEYKLTVKADSFKESTPKLYIDEEGAKITLDGASVSNFDLGNIKLMPNYTSSGAIEGILADPQTGKAIAKGTKVYIYQRNNDATVKPTLLSSFITENETGYFSIDSLPADFYCGSIGEVVTWDISTDKDGNPLSYNVPVNQHIFGWLQVIDGATSKVPGFSK